MLTGMMGWLAVCLSVTGPGPQIDDKNRGEHGAVISVGGTTSGPEGLPPASVPGFPMGELRVQLAPWTVEVVASPGKVLSADPESPLSELLADAEAAYAELAQGRVLEILKKLQREARSNLHRPAVGKLLARALRLEGLTHLFSREPDLASRSFRGAARLDPDFVPDPGQWPPGARLAFGDAVAQARRAGKGSLSVTVKPEVASLWIDGRLVGRGSTTIGNLQPGAHFLTARCPGHVAIGVVVETDADGKLEDTSIFLPALPPETRRSSLVRGVVESLTQGDGRGVSWALTALGWRFAVLVGHRPAGGPSAWAAIREPGIAAGARMGKFPIGLPDRVAKIAAWLRPPATGPSAEAVPPPGHLGDGDLAAPVPWYSNWWFWGSVGAAVVTGVGVGIGLAVSRDRVDIVLGGGR